MRQKGMAGIEVRANTHFARLVAALALLALSASAAPLPDSLAKLIAHRYGAAGFNRVKSIHYVFNVKHGDKEVARTWTWFPKSDSVVYRGKDSAGLTVQASWSRRNAFSMLSPPVRPLDKMFVNDQYWLLFPLHLVWDKGLRMESVDMAESIAGGKSVSGKTQDREIWRLTVAYPSEGGYTPGDAYDLFVDSAGTVRRWAFRRGNTEKPTTETRWSDPAPMGPLRISLERPGMKPGFKLWFSDVRVETTD